MGGSFKPMTMASARLHLYRRPLSAPTKTLSSTPQFLRSTVHCSSCCTSIAREREQRTNKDDFKKWVTLPPFTPQMDASSIGREIVGRISTGKGEPITALKWVRRCCPHLPMSLVQKLFRLRQVSFWILAPHLFVEMRNRTFELDYRFSLLE